jgi:hypothetical protein
MDQKRSCPNLSHFESSPIPLEERFDHSYVLETKARKNPVISDAMHKSPSILPRNCPTFWDVTVNQTVEWEKNNLVF